MFLYHILLSSISLADVPVDNIIPSDAIPSEKIVLEDAFVDGKKSAITNSVDIGLLIVHASSKGNNIDPKLRSLASHFDNYNYTSYSLIKEHHDVIKDKKEKSYPIPGNKTIVTISILSHDEKRARLKIHIMGANGKLLLDTTASVKRNGTFIVAGPKYKDGILFLPITAKY